MQIGKLMMQKYSNKKLMKFSINLSLKTPKVSILFLLYKIVEIAG
jgi:hypothetical protein